MSTVLLSVSDSPPSHVQGGAVAVGNFDGVHRGHAALVAAVRAEATRINGPAVAVTFDPHPMAILSPDRPSTPLTTLADRCDLLHAAGVDHVVVLAVTPQLLAIDAHDFLDGVLANRFSARAVVEGQNFCFGRGRAGNVELLSSWCRHRGVALTVVPPALANGDPISSSRVREAIEAGDVQHASDMLARPYRIRGMVVAAARRGRTIGFPTANLEGIETLIPADGVYAALAVLADGARWPAAVNIGPNPTFGDARRKIEAHLASFSGDLYGQPVAVEFLTRLRNLRTFDGVDTLVAQLRIDVASAAEVARRSLEP